MPRNLDFSALFGTLERTLTSDLPLRRRLLYTTELLGHINFGAYDYAKKDLNELPLRREVLYPAELLAHILPVLYPKNRRVSTQKAFPFGEGGTASAVTDEAKYKNYEKVVARMLFLFTIYKNSSIIYRQKNLQETRVIPHEY